MRRLVTLRSLVIATATCVVVVMPAPALGADNVVTDKQLFQAGVCVGPPCADGEVLGSIPFHIKRGDTPAIRLNQTPDGGFTAQVWDIGGNEANFFVRDVTGGSRLPLRIRPNAITSQIDLFANGETHVDGVAMQRTTRSNQVVDDGAILLAALRTLQFERYRSNGATTPHFGPTEAAFSTAFGVGDANFTAYSDMSGVALAAVKALDACVTAINLTPGPQGATGATGATGPTGATGTAAPADQLTAAQRRIAALERANKAQAKTLLKLQKQMKLLLARR